MDLKQKIDNKTVVTGIIGLGYVGLPLMHSICRSGGQVIGFDIVPEKAEQLNSGISYLETVPSEIIESYREKDLFEATSDFSKLSDVDVIVICVPTPLTNKKEPDLSYVLSTANTIATNLKKGQMVILESTTYPGTLSGEVKPILEEKTGLTAGKDFYLAFSPEREDPGNPDFETSTIPKIVGADTEKERGLATAFYTNFLQEVVTVSSSATAEAVKLTENIFRAVNIALVNELKVVYEKMGIDIWDVIEGAKTKPFGYMPFYPGPGLGGHCIPIDPFYLTWKAKQHGIDTRFIELAGEINTAMPDYVVLKTIESLDQDVQDAHILIIGVAYKKNINDQRESPAFVIIEKLEMHGAKVDYYDPHIPKILPSREHTQLSGRTSIDWNAKTLGDYDAVVIVTEHDKVNYQDIADNAQLVIDTRNVMYLFSEKARVVKA